MSTYETQNEKSMLKICHSAYQGQCPEVFSQSAWKSEIIISSNGEKNVHGKQQPLSSMGSSDYYKRFDYDAIAMKEVLSDSSSENIVTSKKGCLTNSDLEKLEEKLFKNISVEVIVNDASYSSLDSNIKYLKTTIQRVFDSFYKNMKDFELYKQKFNEIIAKNREDSVAEMEDFITDMIQHIMSSESDLNNGDKESKTKVTDKELNLTDSEKQEENNSERDMNLKAADSNCTLESCKSNNNLIFSTPAEEPRLDQNKTDNIVNVLFLTDQPCVEVKICNRNLYSEVNIAETAEREKIKVEAASAENLQKIAAKKLELENYEKSVHDCSNNGIQRNIPVKESRAEQNIYLNNDFVQDEDKGDVKSFISKICCYLCRKIRKNTFG